MPAGLALAGFLFAGDLTAVLPSCPSRNVSDEIVNELSFHFPARIVARGDGSYVVRPGRPVERETLRVAEVAAKLDVTAQHVKNLIEEGALEAFNVGGSERNFWRVRIEALEKFMKEHSSLNARPG